MTDSQVAAWKGCPVLVDPTRTLVAGDPWDQGDWFEAEIIGPAEGPNSDLRIMYGSPAHGLAFCADVDLNDILPISD